MAARRKSSSNKNLLPLALGAVALYFLMKPKSAAQTQYSENAPESGGEVTEANGSGLTISYEPGSGVLYKP
jgi:hypothetical protein